MRDSNSGFADLVRIVRYDTRYASRCLALPGLELLTPPSAFTRRRRNCYWPAAGDTTLGVASVL
jgi:predicted amidohydrolase